MMVATVPQRPGREETEPERLTRNLHELLNEIRVAMPGVQVLFAFLLAVPFQARFADVTDFQRGVYFATLLCAGAATACFIAPTAYHRILFRHGEKSNLVFLASRLVIAGLVALALAMTLAVILIADVLFGAVATAITGAAIGALFAGLWFVIPLSRR
jgi:hypothetical protein